MPTESPSPAADDQPRHRIADILVPVALDMAYSYRLPPGQAFSGGDVVAVPLGTRETIGIIWDIREVSQDPGNLKSVIGRLDAPTLPAPLRRFLDRVAAYTLAPRGMVARMALKGAPGEERPERIAIAVRATGKMPERKTPARARVLAILANGLAYTKRDLAIAAGTGLGVIDGLIDDGVLEAFAMPKPVKPEPDPAYASPALSTLQEQAAAGLRAAVAARRFSVTLIDGVTGSGKTEVYFEAIAEALRQGRQSLVLMPEIALTAQFLARFAQRFGVGPAEWHSGVSGRKRERVYRGLASGAIKVLVGARSALFLPYADLGLVVVDEEHEQAYRQEDGVHYHARDMAVLRANTEGFAVVLASATPSVETKVNVLRGRYGHAALPSRFGAAHLPSISLVDLRKEGAPRGRWLSPRLITAAHEALARKEQALFFLNRRGYAPLTLCDVCGHRFKCPHCDAWLVEHRFTRALQCHHCGHRERMPVKCPNCGTPDRLIACGPGIERLAEEVAETFPGAHTLILSSDLPGGTERLRRELDEISAGRVDIVIGTQIVAKGHNFPNMTVVGVVDADIGLSTADLRAAERTFQIVQQVSGRAGRFEKPGQAFLQTRDPDHPVMQALQSGDSERFYTEEIALRRAACMPPFGRLAALIVSGKDRAEAEAHARALLRAAPRLDGITIYGPADAPISVIRGRYRIRLLVKARREDDIQGFVRLMIGSAPKPRGSVRVSIDIDPMNFL